MKSILIICLAVLLAVVPVLHSPAGGTEVNEGLSGTGRWVPYAVDFIGSGPFIADDEQYSAILPANINSGDGIQFNCGGHWFNYELSGGKMQWWYIDKGKEETKNIGSILSSQGVAGGNNVTYQNTFWGTDARYTAHSYGLREVFILDALPDGVSVGWNETYLEYTGELSWDDGLSVWADGVEHPDKTFRTSGDIDFRDISTGESVFYIPAPTAWDSGGNTCELVYDVKVSADKIQYGLRVPYEFLAVAVFPVYIDPDNWVSPTGHNDIPNEWETEGNAYDNNTDSKACTALSGGELELTIGAISCDKVRIYASDFVAIPSPLESNPTVTISVYYDSAYHQIFSGSITKKTWVEKSIGSTETVTKAKISGTLATNHLLYLYEFDFNSLILPTVETDACSGVKSTLFDANGDIIVSGGATKRGFHYSKVFDGFEWGSDGDSLATDWASPTGHNDLDTWAAETFAYDGDTGTRADTHVSGGELELTIGAILCDKIRLYASDFYSGSHDPDVTISVYYDSAYHEIFSGVITKDTWVEKAIGSTKTVTKAKISGTLAASHVLRIYEFEFNSITPSGGAIDWTIVVAGTSKAEINTAQHYSGTRSARLYRGDNNAAAYFLQTALTPTQTIGFQYRTDGSAYFVFRHGNGTYYLRITILSDEVIYYYDGSTHSTGSSVSVGSWNLISIRNVNWAAHTYDIYLDGILIQSAATMATSAAFSGQVHFISTVADSEVWLDEVAVWDVEDESGSFSEGTYSLEITGLDPETTYYVQAFAKNAVGFGYGLVVSQLTLTQAGYSWGSVIG